MAVTPVGRREEERGEGTAMSRRKQPCAYPGCNEEWSILRCSRCKSAWYCCREHQALHWKAEGDGGHRLRCEAVANERANSRSSRERRSLLLSPSVGAKDLAKEAHVHAKGGLRSALAAQRNAVAELNARLEEIRRAARGKAEAPACTPNYTRAGLEPGSLDSLSESELLALERETIRLRDLAAASCEETERDLGSVREWETYESGYETRDVLANGERRAHMEIRYGREVTVDDVEAEVRGLTSQQRKLKLIEGIAKAARADGRLPGPIAVDNVAGLLE